MDANDLNKRLKELMDGLSVKVRAAAHKHTRMLLKGQLYGCAGSCFFPSSLLSLAVYCKSPINKDKISCPK